MRITMVISSLSIGGAERVLSIMANHWAARGTAVTLLTLAGTDAPPAYPLEKQIDLIQLDIMDATSGFLSAFHSNRTRVRLLREAIAASRPDTVISFMDTTNVLTLLACRPLDVPVIVSERTVPELASISLPWKMLRRLTYPMASRIVVQTEAVLHRLPARQRARAAVIANPVLPSNVTADSRRPDGRFRLMAAGRMHDYKGFDILLRAFGETRTSHANWTLTIHGDGPERATLQSLIREIGLDDCVHLPGFTDDVPKELASADIFVLSSLLEGFPNVLLEAMAQGLPVVSTDCPYGPGEIITHEKNGLLVPARDHLALAGALERLMTDASLRSSLGQQALRDVERFSADRIMSLWDTTIQSIRRADR